METEILTKVLLRFAIKIMNIINKQILMNNNQIYKINRNK